MKGAKRSVVNVDETDWAHLDAMTDEEAEANALADPDNPPVTQAQLRAAPRMPQVRVIRRALGLTQEEFALRYENSARYAA